SWAYIITRVPVLGPAGTTTREEIRKCDDDGLPEKLGRVRAAEARAGRPAGSVRFASTVFSYSPTESTSATAAIAERLGAVFGLAPDALRRHPIALVGTADEMIAELRRRERVHGLSLLALKFSSPQPLPEVGERRLPHVPG